MGLLNVFDHVGCEPWCRRGPCRAPVVEIFQWATACTWTIGGPAWTGVGLHALHVQPVNTAMGFHERYRSGGHGGPRVSWGPLHTALHTAFGHRPIFF